MVRLVYYIALPALTWLWNYSLLNPSFHNLLISRPDPHGDTLRSKRTLLSISLCFVNRNSILFQKLNVVQRRVRAPCDSKYTCDTHTAAVSAEFRQESNDTIYHAQSLAPTNVWQRRHICISGVMFPSISLFIFYQ